MSRPKPPHTVRYTVRLNRAQGERVAALKAQLQTRSDNEVFDYLVTAGTNQRDDLEQLVYSLFGIWRTALPIGFGVWRPSASFISP